MNGKRNGVTGTTVNFMEFISVSDPQDSIVSVVLDPSYHHFLNDSPQNRYTIVQERTSTNFRTKMDFIENAHYTFWFTAAEKGFHMGRSLLKQV